MVGLGRMGQGMAARLLLAGHQLVVANRTPQRAAALEAQGARLASSPAEAVAGVDAVLVMVSDDQASRSVWQGRGGILAGVPKPAAFAIECSTLSRDWVLGLAGSARQAGWRYLDCPVTGLPAAAAAGELTLLVGADSADLAQAGALLAALGKVIHFGPVGAGTAYKLIVNLMGAVQIAGLAEGLALAERAGLDLKQVAEALSQGQAGSPQVIRNAKRMVVADHAQNVTFSGDLRRKDTAYAMRLAEQLGLPTPLGKVALDGLDLLLASGLGEQNESSIIEVARRGS